MLYYRDFVTGKRRRTFGKPVRVERGGLLNAWGLVVENRCSEMWIPEYCLRGMACPIPAIEQPSFLLCSGCQERAQELMLEKYSKGK